MNVKRILIIVGIVATTWYGLKWYAGYQTLRYAFSCAQDMNLPSLLKGAKSDDQARAVIGRHLDCLENKLRFPASAFFDKKETLATMKFSPAK